MATPDSPRTGSVFLPDVDFATALLVVLAANGLVSLTLALILGWTFEAAWLRTWQSLAVLLLAIPLAAVGAMGIYYYHFTFIFVPLLLAMRSCLRRVESFGRWCRSFAILFLSLPANVALLGLVLVLGGALSDFFPPDPDSVLYFVTSLVLWVAIYGTLIVAPIWLGIVLGWLVALPVILCRRPRT